MSAFPYVPRTFQRWAGSCQLSQAQQGFSQSSLEPDTYFLRDLIADVDMEAEAENWDEGDLTEWLISLCIYWEARRLWSLVETWGSEFELWFE